MPGEFDSASPHMTLRPLANIGHTGHQCAVPIPFAPPNTLQEAKFLEQRTIPKANRRAGERKIPSEMRPPAATSIYFWPNPAAVRAIDVFLLFSVAIDKIAAAASPH